MGMVFGRTGAGEPAFDMVLNRTTARVPYEIRRYGPRLAVEAPSSAGASPFMLLAGYIGVMSKPQNKASQSIAMTTPVAMLSSNPEGTKIAMTTPVVMHTTSRRKIMQFMLPKEYDEVSKVPIPTDSRVSIKDLPGATGAIHRYSGSFDDISSRKKAIALSEQLREDGLVDITDDAMLDQFQIWAYNGPMTIPALKRNEIWLELNEQQVHNLTAKFGEKT